MLMATKQMICCFILFMAHPILSRIHNQYERVDALADWETTPLWSSLGPVFRLKHGPHCVDEFQKLADLASGDDTCTTGFKCTNNAQCESIDCVLGGQVVTIKSRTFAPGSLDDCKKGTSANNPHPLHLDGVHNRHPVSEEIVLKKQKNGPIFDYFVTEFIDWFQHYLDDPNLFSNDDFHNDHRRWRSSKPVIYNPYIDTHGNRLILGDSGHPDNKDQFYIIPLGQNWENFIIDTNQANKNGGYKNGKSQITTLFSAAKHDCHKCPKRNNFFNSLRGAFILQQILQLKDRHVGNLQLKTDDCTVFNMDFGNILGRKTPEEEPKKRNMAKSVFQGVPFYNMPYYKELDDYLEAIGLRDIFQHQIHEDLQAVASLLENANFKKKMWCWFRKKTGPTDASNGVDCRNQHIPVGDHTLIDWVEHITLENRKFPDYIYSVHKKSLGKTHKGSLSRIKEWIKTPTWEADMEAMDNVKKKIMLKDTKGADRIGAFAIANRANFGHEYTDARDLRNNVLNENHRWASKYKGKYMCDRVIDVHHNPIGWGPFPRGMSAKELPFNANDYIVYGYDESEIFNDAFYRGYIAGLRNSDKRFDSYWKRST